MKKSNIIDYKNPSQNLVMDFLSEFLRESAQKMLQLDIEEEGQTFMSSYQDKLLTNGSKQVVRNGFVRKPIHSSFSFNITDDFIVPSRVWFITNNSVTWGRNHWSNTT
jgi:predicted restriction endonuclease